MRLALCAGVGLSLGLSGCAELATGLMMYSDQIDAEQGYYYDDQHFSDTYGPECPGAWDTGRVNNQTYQRARNQGNTEQTVTMTWSTGLQEVVVLAPGEASPYFYMTPSVTPDSIEVSCDRE
jgi:hypothetical protein